MGRDEAQEKGKKSEGKRDHAVADVMDWGSRKRRLPQTEEFSVPYDPSVPYEDNCLMQED